MSTTHLTDALPHVANRANRFAFVDVARAIAALCVMLQHSLEASGVESLASGAIATTWLNLGETGVAIFFLVSGFIIPASIRGTPTIGRFGIRRILRIYPLYWAVFVVTLLISIYLRDEPAPPVLQTLATHVPMLQSWLRLPNYVGGSWTLLIEIVWYVSFALFFFSRIGAGQRLIVAFLAAFLAVVAVTSVSFEHFPFGRFAIFSLCFFGYLFFLRFEGEVAQGRFRLLASAFLLLIGASIWVGFWLYPSNAFSAPNFTCVAISWGAALVFFPLLLRHRDSKFAHAPIMRYLGEISYSLYLTHSPIMAVLVLLGLTGPAFIVLTFALTILVSTFTFKFIEKPGVALARRLTQGRPRDSMVAASR